MDGVAFAIAQLRAQPARFRRAILLLSETIDHGSKTTLSEALRFISDTNTTMYSFGFSSTRSAVSHEASKYGTRVRRLGVERVERAPPTAASVATELTPNTKATIPNKCLTASASLLLRFDSPQ